MLERKPVKDVRKKLEQARFNSELQKEAVVIGLDYCIFYFIAS